MGSNIINLTSVILILLGLVFVIVALVNNKRVKAAESWPIIPGTIVQSGIKEYINRSGGVTSHSYEPVITYKYTLLGKLFEGKRLGFGSTRVKYDEAQKITNEYLSGSPVNVHYNPNKPEESVLEVKARSSKAFLILGIIFLVLGILLFLLGMA